MKFLLMTIATVARMTSVRSAARIAALSVAIAWPASAQDDVSSSMVDRDDVLEMVDQLDAPESVKRREAEQWLEQAGPAALEFLPEVGESRSKDANNRLAKIRLRLQAMKAEAGLVDVRVYLNQVSSLSEALEAISRDSGVEFEYSGDKTVPIDAVATPLPFWHAVDLVLDQAKLDVNFYGGSRETLMLVPREDDRPDRVMSAAYTGVYRLEPTTVTAKRVLTRPSLSGLNVSLEIAWEPRVTPIGLTIPIDQVSAILDDGGRLKSQSSGDTIDIATNSDIAFSEFYLPMELPVGSPQKIKRLTGVLQALLPSERQRFQVSLVGEGTSQKIDAMTVTVEQAKENGTIYEVRVGVALENPDRSLESHRQWLFSNEAFVVGADGGRIDHLGFNVFRQASDGAGISYLFDLGDDLSELKFVYVSPTAVVKNEVPFVLTDITLP